MAFTSVPPQGYFLEVVDAPEPAFEHSLGGEQDLPGAFCTSCKLPFLLMMSLDVRDGRLGLQWSKGRGEATTIPLLYCWSCGDWLDYRLKADGSIERVGDQPDGWAGSCFPYEPYPKSFPRAWIRLDPVPPETQQRLRKANTDELDGSPPAPRHQVGGEPRFVQRTCVEGGWACEVCGKDAPFLAVVGDDAGGGRQFHRNAYLQVVFHYCQACQVVNAYHECD
jgi:hypothetical protein